MYKIKCSYCGRDLIECFNKKDAEIWRKQYPHTKTKTFCCKACKGDYNHYLQERRYLNINPDGRIHRNE